MLDHQECEETMSDVETVTPMTNGEPSNEKNLSVGSKRKKVHQKTTTTKKQMTKLDQLMNCPISKLHEFYTTNLKKDIKSTDNLIHLLDGLTEVQGNQYPLTVMIILIGIVCSSHWEDLLHPQKIKMEAIQNWWKTHLEYMIPMTNYLKLLTTLRKNLRTAFKNMDVSFTLHLLPDATDTCPLWLCHQDLLELIESLRNLDDLLSNIPQTTGTFTPLMETTSTSDIYAPTQMNLADAYGSETQTTSRCTGNVNFAELLERSTCNQATTRVSCDTYVQALDSSKELVASTNMKGYVIDINIYRYVLLNYLIKLRNEFINENYNRSNTFKLLKIKNKKDIPYMNFNQANDYFNKLYGSKFLLNIRKTVPFNSEIHAFNVCRKLLNFPYSFINDIHCFRRMFSCDYVLGFYLDDEHSCNNCGFTHFNYDIVEFHKKYPLITIKHVKDIFAKCQSIGPLNHIVTSP